MEPRLHHQIWQPWIFSSSSKAQMVVICMTCSLWLINHQKVSGRTITTGGPATKSNGMINSTQGVPWTPPGRDLWLGQPKHL